MACQAIHSWTVAKLIGSFLDLAIAYVLLCCSTLAFIVSIFLDFFGFSLPCTCNGLLSKPNPDHCLQKMLVDCPLDKISGVQMSVRSRLPFDSVWKRDKDCQLSFKMLRDMKLELEGGASCSSVFSAKNEGLAGAEEGRFDGKRKGVVRSRKQRGNLQRRRKISTENTKFSTNSSYDNVKSGAPTVPLSKYDVVEPTHVMELDHKSWLSSDSNGAIDANKFEDRDVGLLGAQRNDTGQNLEHDGHLENAVKILEQALKEECSARAALFFDLEKERTAAATAADEAMAMIARLQEEKAAIELEARQYERILEEKSTYDAEEMDILKEIIIRREMEKHFLEKEVESYRKMIQEKEQLEEDACNVLDFQGEILLVPGENDSLINFVDNASISVENAGQVHNSTDEVVATPEDDHGFHEKSVVLIGKMKNEEETESKKQYDDDKGSGDDIYDVHVIDDNKKNKAESSMTHAELPSELRQDSIATIVSVDHGRWKLNSEVGCLREKLRNIQEGREKLNYSKEHRDKGETELLLLEDIGNLLQEIRQLTEPQMAMRRTSLPPPCSKDTSKKRRCRSESLVPYQSS